MAALVENLEHDSCSKAMAPCTSKMQNLPTQVLRKRVDNVKSSKSKQAEQSLKVLTKLKRIDIKESNTQSAEPKKIMCICAPPTHEGSFKCRFHRKTAPQKLPPRS